nr:hypothetical protein 5 [Gammaproteobacteria bacterium]
MLFENKNREDQSHKTHIESDFEYLDRSGRLEAQRVRDFLNEWIGKFPENEAIELISRITSRDRRSFDSATFEIVLFAIISSLGGILEVHPELENGSEMHPDFLVHMPNGDEFYLEAVLASEFSEAEKAAERRKNVVLEAIEKLDSPNFFIGINAEGNPDTPPRGKALRRDLARWLEGLDPDQVARDVNEQGHDRIPTLVWEHDGWQVEFEAIPIKPERRGKGQRVIGVQFYGARWANEWEPIRDAVRSKGGRYGEFTKPFVVAVNVDSGSLDRIDEMQALFGQEEFVFSRANPDAGPEMRRAPNGAWSGPNGPQYTRVSGVWIFGSVNPWNIVSRKNTLYVNPWAQLPLPVSLLVINHAMANNGKMEWAEGERLSSVLGLSEDWPEC